MNWLGIAMVTAVLNLILAEAFDWFPWLAARIVHLASRFVPVSSRSRWELEWLAEMDALPGRKLSVLIFALGVLRGAPAVRLAVKPESPRLRNLLGKRAFDIAVSAIMLVLLVPMLAVAAALVRTMCGPGPVFYRQVRVGQGGKTFMIIKFRTFSASSSEIRPAGAWLRRTSLDEVPQLLNVLRGDMSLVGPPPRRHSRK